MTTTLATTTEQDYEEIYFTSRDGLKLYGRHYWARGQGGTRPVVCLAGLTRNSRDFHTIAVA